MTNGTLKEEKVFDILEGTNTNWTVKKLPLLTACGLETNRFGLFRNDNDHCLSVMKENYQVMQNSTLVELLVNATEMLDLSICNGGSLQDGQKVFYQIELPSDFIGKSSVKRQITAINSHDGSTAIGFGSSNTVVVCQNTFYKAYGQIEKVRHTLNSYEKVVALSNRIKEAIVFDEALMNTFHKMAEVTLEDEMVEKLVKKMFPATKMDSNLEDLTTRTKNKVVAFSDAIKTEIELEGKTVWGLFNAVTRFTNHILPSKKEKDNTSFLMLGTGAALSNMAYNELLQYIEINSSEYVLVSK